MGLAAEVDPGHPPAYLGRLRLRKGTVAVRTSEGVDVLTLNTHFPEIFLSIWTNHSSAPDEISIGVASDDPQEAFIQRLVAANRELQPLLREHLGEDCELLSYLFIGDVVRFAEGLHESARGGDRSKELQLERLLQSLEREYAKAEADVENLIAIEWFETLMTPSASHEHMRGMLGPTLKQGLKKMEAWRPDPKAKLEYALKMYGQERGTLGWAANEAGVSIREMANEAAARGILRLSSASAVEAKAIARARKNQMPKGRRAVRKRP